MGNRRDIVRAAVAVACLAGCEPGRTGSRAAAFALTDPSGHAVTLAGYAGRPLVLAFTASWAPTARAAMKTLARAQREFGSAGVGVVALAVDEDVAALKRMAKEPRATVPVAAADASTVRGYFGRRDVVLPTIFVIDGRGVIRARLTGIPEWEALAAAVQAVRARGGP